MKPLQALAIAALTLAGCGAPSSEPSRLPVKIAVGGQAELIYLPATLAQEMGFYNDEGVDVTLLDFPGGAKALEALLGGSADVVCGFYDHTVQMAAQGRELRAFVAMMRYPGLVAMAATPGIARIEDLKGRTVGVSAPGSSTHMFLNYLLIRHGLKPEDVSTASIGMAATAVGAMTHGKVDAAILTDPTVQIVRKQQPSARILADTRTPAGVRQIYGVETYPSAVFYSTASWISAHPKEARRLAHALTHTLEWMRTHSAEQIRARMPEHFRTEDEPADLESLRSYKEMLSPDGKLALESVEIVRQVLSLSLASVRSTNIDLAKTYTNEFIGR